MKAYILFNSKSDNGKGEEHAKKAAEFFKDEADYRDITKLSDYSGFFGSLKDGDKVVICGGDGTLTRFVNDIYDLKVERDIYYYPSGTGNDFYHDVAGEGEAKPVKINEYIKNLPTVTVKGKTCRFINGVGYGIDGYCCEVGDIMREKDPGKPINYTSIAIKGLLFHYKPANATVTVDGKKYTFKKAWLVPTMNGRRYGGGMIPTPDQKRIADDKKLSVMVMNGAGKLRTLIAFPSIFEGKHIEKKMTTVLEGKSITVEFDRPTALQIDGETVTGVEKYEAKA